MNHVVVNPSYTHLSDFIDNIPSRYDIEGEMIYDSSRNQVKMFMVDNKKIVVKRFNPPMIHQRVAYTLFKPSKAKRAYEYGMKLLELQISTPVPIAYIETFSSGLMKLGYFVSEYCGDPDARIIREEPDQHDDLIDAIARFLVDCHQKGFVHGDTNLSNFLYHATPEGFHITTIDINRSLFMKHPTHQQCLNSLMRLTHVRPALIRLVSRYAMLRSLDQQSSVDYVLRQLDHFERRKQMKRKIKLKAWMIGVMMTLQIYGFAQIPSPLLWGDQGTGNYINPILNADYSDPDVIRVGSKYYMVASDFHFVGMQVLESTDMVNWRILTQVYHRFDYPGWDSNDHYAGGSWAPSIRYHNGKYWIYFCTPDEGLFMTQAFRPEGPWTPLHLVKAVKRWEDPCPLWDDDGQAYLGRSQHGAGPIIIHKMSADGRTLLDDGRTVYTGPVAEGTKFLKRNGWYYLSIPEGGVEGGWQTALRSKNIYGPYEKKVVLEQGSTSINGPHQGAIVDTPEGEWWFYHFQSKGALGRVVHLQPMHWEDDWPVMGQDFDGNGIGEPVTSCRKPHIADPVKSYLPQTSDDFEQSSLSPQWQWNHNPDDKAWSLTEHQGELTLHGLKADRFSKARNTLTQKVMGYESMATVAIDVSHMADGGCSGLVCMGMMNEKLGLMKRDGQLHLYHGGWGGDKEVATPTLPKKLYLRIAFDMPGKSYQFSYSIDNQTYIEVNQPFFVDFGNWKGVRFGLYHYNVNSDEGYVTFPWVTYDVTK